MQKRLNLLQSVWLLYERWTAAYDWACRRGCAWCCTCNVTLTTLEAFWIFNRLPSPQLSRLTAKLRHGKTPQRFRPRLTTNGLAELCAAGGEPPADAEAITISPCPLLEDDLCPIYPYRPFACRCLNSTRDCGASGQAAMDPFLVTLNHVTQQIIEDIDHGGCFGNLADVLECLASGTNREAYRKGLLAPAAATLVPNRPLKILLVPLEHRRNIRIYLQELDALR